MRLIYTDSFPASERELFENVIEEIESGRGVLFTLEEDSRLRGFALFRPFRNAGLIYLEYIAVASDFRNRRLGGELLDYAMNVFRNDSKIKGIILEVESPNGDNVRESELRERRIKFYQRHGAEVIYDNDAYLMPDYTGSGTLSMKLLWIPLTPEAKGLPSKNLKSWIILIYEDVYKRSQSDSLVQSVLCKLP